MNDCCIITTARYEELYLDEWINYHLNLGFSHIYICDNNEPEDILKLEHKKVTIIPCNDIDFSLSIYNALIKCYDRVLLSLLNKHDFCAVIDVDEFLYLNGSVKDFCNLYLSYEYDYVEIPWIVYNDNDLIFHMDHHVQKLYTKPQNKVDFDWKKNLYSWGKSIFRMSKVSLCDCHSPLNKNLKSTVLDKTKAHIKHYRTKCLEDYIKQKCLIRNASNTPFTKFGDIIKTYFETNEVNLDKLLWALKFCVDCNLQLSTNDKNWVLEQFNLYNPITVVIRTYNRLETLKNCILNTVNKLNCSCKVLILNDGSMDGTNEWLASLNFDYLSLKTNVGPGEILARGKYLITTPYYLMLDDDDEWIRNDVIKFFYKELIKNPYCDLINTGTKSHCTRLVSTLLLLKCPNLSMFKYDDSYIYWIQNKAVNVVNTLFNFYNYRIDLPDVTHVRSLDSTILVAPEYFYSNESWDNLIDIIYNNYPTYTLKDRKVADQIVLYIKERRE